MIIKASKGIPTNCHVNSNIYLKIKWLDGTIITKLKAKNIYYVINHSESIINHVNKIWYTDLDVSSWKKLFDKLQKVQFILKLNALNGFLF